MAKKATQFDISVLIKVLNEASKPVLQIAKDVKKFSDQSSKSLDKFSKSARQAGKNISKVGKDLSTKLTLPVLAFGTTAAIAWNKQAQAVEQVRVAIEATGGAAGKTLKELEDSATRLQEKTLFGDEEILAGATAQLLTFTNIAGAQFDRTQQAILDVSTRLAATSGGTADLTSTSIMLGKALNDPIANLGALGRSGIQFTKDQKNLIKRMVETGRIADAQNLILTELEKQYGGSAEAAAKAGTGGIKQLMNSIGDLHEEFGKLIVEAINPLLPKLKLMVSGAIEFVKANPGIIKMIGLFAGLFAVLGPVLFIFGKIVMVLGPIAKSIAMISKGLFVLSKAFLFLGKAALKGLAMIAKGFISLVIAGGPVLWTIMAIATAAFLIIRFWKPIKAFLISIWDGFSRLLENPFFRAIGTIFLPFITIPALIIKHWKPIKEFFSNLGDSIGNIFSRISGFFDNDTKTVNIKTEDRASKIEKSIIDAKSETDIKIKVITDEGVATETMGVSRRRGDANVSVQNTGFGSFALN